MIAVSIHGASPLLFGNFNLSNWLSSFFRDPIRAITNEFCTYFARNPTRGQTAITRLNEFLRGNNETQQALPQTIAYLSVPENQQKLTAGGDQCPAFFRELFEKLRTDWQNRRLPPGQVQQKASEIFQRFADILRSIVQSKA